METVIRDLDALSTSAESFFAGLSPKTSGATLVTLSGELGAGKTAFTKALAKAAGVEDDVTSPTFVLEKIYGLSGQAFSRLVHIDAYRLKNGSELGALGFGEILKDARSLVVLEWPERVADALPQADHALTFTPSADGSRTISYA